MRARNLSCLFFLLTIIGCSHKTVDAEAARKLSDNFMSDLIAHSTAAAYDKMELEFTKLVGRSESAPLVEELFQYCGWPQDSDLKDIQNGYKITADGHRNPIRKFVYAATTMQFGTKGQCYLSVEVARSSDGVRVTSFGPLKVTSGNPYP